MNERKRKYVLWAIAGIYDWNGRHQILVGIGCQGDAVVLVDRNHQRSTRLYQIFQIAL